MGLAATLFADRGILISRHGPAAFGEVHTVVVEERTLGEVHVLYGHGILSEGAEVAALSFGQAALCFARPVDDHACQVKGTYVEARSATKAERAIVDAQWDQSLRQLEQIGIPRQLWAGYAVWPCVAVRVRVTEVFDQTPGPGAGARLT